MDIVPLTSGRQKLRPRSVKKAIKQAEQRRHGHYQCQGSSSPQLDEGEEGRLQRVLVNGGIEEGKGL
jgi:hypothetical protein